MALFSICRLVASLLCGLAAKRTSNEAVFDASLVVMTVGNMLYFFAAELGLWALIAGRVLVGFGSGNFPIAPRRVPPTRARTPRPHPHRTVSLSRVWVWLLVPHPPPPLTPPACARRHHVSAGTLSVARAAVAECTTVEERTRYLAILDAARFIGYAITPVLGVALAYVHVSSSGFVFDDVTSPGLLLAVVNVALLAYSRWPRLASACHSAAAACRGLFPSRHPYELVDASVHPVAETDECNHGSTSRACHLPPVCFRVCVGELVRAELSVYLCVCRAVGRQRSRCWRTRRVRRVRRPPQQRVR